MLKNPLNPSCGLFPQLYELVQILEKGQYLASHPLNGVEVVDWVCDSVKESQSQGGICYVIGNGGSAGIASHVASEFLKGLKLRAMTFTDADLLTCIGNDMGYENTYAVPLQVLMKKEDMLIAISSSGRSRNLIQAVQVAQEVGATVITLTGGVEDNPLKSLGNLNIWLDSREGSLIESGHFFILHMFIDEYKRRLPL